MPSSVTAFSRARSLSSKKAGAIAFSRTGDSELGEFADTVMLFKAGEVPEDVFDRGSAASNWENFFASDEFQLLNRRAFVNPRCPNCGRSMTLIRDAGNPNDQHTFECGGCKIIYMTEDHVPVAGNAKERGG